MTRWIILTAGTLAALAMYILRPESTEEAAIIKYSPNAVKSSSSKKLPKNSNRTSPTRSFSGKPSVFAFQSQTGDLGRFRQQGWSGDWLPKRLAEEQRFLSGREAKRQSGDTSEVTQETWRNEDRLFEHSHSLRLGMTAQEVAGLLGKPLKGVNPEELPEPDYQNLDAVLQQFSPYGGDKCQWKYSPSPIAWSRFERPSNYQLLVVGFGRDNRVRMWFWAESDY
jgi:hypothetical protein